MFKLKQLLTSTAFISCDATLIVGVFLCFSFSFFKGLRRHDEFSGPDPGVTNFLHGFFADFLWISDYPSMMGGLFEVQKSDLVLFQQPLYNESVDKVINIYKSIGFLLVCFLFFFSFFSQKFGS